MKNSYIITLALTISLFTTTSLFASNGTKPTFTINTLIVTATNNGGVQLHTTLTSATTESFEIQRSYDNKNFQTIAMIMNSDENSMTQAIKLNDKVNRKAAKVFYRLVKTNGENANVIVKTNVALH